MKKLFFWLLFLIAISAAVPPIRVRVAPRVQPVRDYLVREVGPPLQRGIDPVLRWSAVQETRRIARELRQRELSFLPLPNPRDFTKFLERQHYGSDGLDPWETPYFLLVRQDSILVISAGPDRERGTPDDIREGVSKR